MILNIAATGHVNPTIDLVTEAQARGFRVSYCIPESPQAETIRRTGASVRPYSSLLTARPTTSASPAELAAWLPFVLLAESKQVLPQLLDSNAGDVPDVLLVDRTAYTTGRVLAHRWGRPWVTLFPSFASGPGFSVAAATGQQSVLDPEHHAYQALRDQLNAYAQHFAVDPISVADVALSRSDDAVVVVPRAFQYAGETFASRYAFVGPCLRERSRLVPVRYGSSAHVYASLGTAFTDRPDVYASVVGAIEDTGLTGLVSTGGVTHEWSDHPRVVTKTTVDQLAALRTAEVFLTHGGMGSVLEGLSAEVPLVCLPHSTEQQLVARRVEELGLGRTLDPGAAVADIRDALVAVRGDLGIRQNLAMMRRAIDASGGASAALDTIAQVLARPVSSLAG